VPLKTKQSIKLEVSKQNCYFGYDPIRTPPNKWNLTFISKAGQLPGSVKRNIYCFIITMNILFVGNAWRLVYQSVFPLKTTIGSLFYSSFVYCILKAIVKFSTKRIVTLHWNVFILSILGSVNLSGYGRDDDHHANST